MVAVLLTVMAGGEPCVSIRSRAVTQKDDAIPQECIVKHGKQHVPIMAAQNMY